MNFNEGEKNAYSAIRSLIKNAKIKVTDQSVKQALWHHPDFPSFASFSDVLTDFKVENMGTRISIQQLSEIPLPALVHLENGGDGFFGTVTKIKDEVIDFEVNGKKTTEHFSQFMRYWGGITLLIQPTELSGETNYKIKSRLEIIRAIRLPFIGLALSFIAIGFWVLLSEISLDVSFALFLLKIAGTIISSLLIWQSLDSNNSFLLSICQFNEKTNCNSILQSKGAKLFGLVSWAEIGLFYFTGGMLSLLFNKNASHFIIFFNYLALPYVLYSLYYQAFVVKKWCVLCLVVQAIFILEFCSSLYINAPVSSNTVQEIMLYSIIPLLWWLLKPIFEKGHLFENTSRELQKIIFNSDYIQTIFSNANPLPVIFEGMRPILLGNPKANHTITIVANPTCAACSLHISELADLLLEDHDFNAQLILASGTNENHVADKVALKLMSLPKSLNSEMTVAWFKNPDLKKWENENQIEITHEGIEQIILNQRWLSMVNVYSAPALFFGNIRLPRVYGIKAIPKLSRILQLNQDLIRSTK